VAAAATLPVQVRRSRVPVLAVSERYHPAEAAGTPVPAADVASFPNASDGEPVRRSNRLRLALLLAIAVAVLAFLAIRMFS
jgi:hypothetical protein